MAKKKLKPREGGNWRTLSNIDNPYAFRGTFPPDNSKLQRRVAQDPIVAALECTTRVQRTEANFRDELYSNLQTAYAIGRHLSMNLPDFKKFYELEFFKNRKRKLKAVKQQRNALRHVISYVFQATTEAKRKRTGRYAAALEGYLRAGMPAHLVAKQIRADGGIEKLYEISQETAATRPKRIRAPNAMPEPDFFFGNKPMFHGGKASKTPIEDWSLDDLDAAPDSVNDNFDCAEAIEVVIRGKDPKGRETIELEVPPKMKARLLSLKAGARVVIRLESMGGDGQDPDEGWVRLRAKHAFQCPSRRAKLLRI